MILAEEGPLVERMQSEGISVQVLPMRSRTRLLYKDSVRPGPRMLGAALDTIVYSLRLSWQLRKLRPDVVHTNSLKAGIYGSIAGRLAGRPVVWHLRDRIDADYLPHAAVLLIRTMTRYLPAAVVSNSETTRRTLRRSGPSFVIPSAVAPVGRNRDEATRNGPLIVGIVGRLAPWKGQDVFLKAFAQAFPRGQERAVIVGAPLFGAAESAYAESLRRLAVECGIADRVEFRGHCEDVAAELRRVDVVVHASTIPEPFGQVVVEGLAAHLPVVASRSGGPAEIITDGVDGLLYPPGDVTALAQILQRLDRDPLLREQLGTAGALRSLSYSPASEVERMMEVYQLVCRDPSPARHVELPGRRAPVAR